jgi:hypothetical protein
MYEMFRLEALPLHIFIYFIFKKMSETRSSRKDKFIYFSYKRLTHLHFLPYLEIIFQYPVGSNVGGGHTDGQTDMNLNNLPRYDIPLETLVATAPKSRMLQRKSSLP